MKKLFRKILFGDTPVSEYKTITVLETDVQENVFLQAGKNRINISGRQWPVCLEPMVFAVWLNNKEEISAVARGDRRKIYFNDHKNKTVAVGDLELTSTIEEKDGALFLFTLKKSRIYHLNFIKTRLIFSRYYKKPQQTFSQLKALASAFSYPRKVRMVSFKDSGQFNIFPMDLVGDISGNNRFVFGLRHSNTSLPRIIATKKLVISEIPFTSKDTIYWLGKHHSNPLSPGSMPFGLLSSRHFGFPVPEWASSYKEISLLKTINLGSHMLLWGEVSSDEKLKEPPGHLFHIHFLHYLHQKNNGLRYSLV